MADINISIGGCDDAVFRWDGNDVPLSVAGGVYSATVTGDVGSDHVYVVIVFGISGVAWSATVAAPTHTNSHSGHMSPAGFDMSGTTPFEV